MPSCLSCHWSKLWCLEQELRLNHHYTWGVWDWGICNWTELKLPCTKPDEEFYVSHAAFMLPPIFKQHTAYLCLLCVLREKAAAPRWLSSAWGNALLMDYKQQRLFALFKLKQSKWARDCKSTPSWLEAVLAIIQDKNKASILENAFSQFKNLVFMMDHCSVVSTFRYKALLCRWMYKSKIHKVTLLCVK